MRPSPNRSRPEPRPPSHPSPSETLTPKAPADTAILPAQPGATPLEPLSPPDPSPMRRPHRSTHGGKRPGAGCPRGPRRATVERQAAIYALFDDPHERALLDRIAPLDIIEVAARRLLADGNLYAAAHLAAYAAPYRHHRKRTVTTDAAGHPVGAARPTPPGEGVAPKQLAPPAAPDRT